MKKRDFLILASIIALPILAYIIARYVVALLSISPGLGEVIIISLLVWAVLLIVPFLMLKSTFHNAKVEDGAEKELKIKDLPKDAVETQIKYPNRH